jgi:hypothetical protein
MSADRRDGRRRERRADAKHGSSRETWLLIFLTHIASASRSSFLLSNLCPRILQSGSQDLDVGEVPH